MESHGRMNLIYMLIRFTPLATQEIFIITETSLVVTNRAGECYEYLVGGSGMYSIMLPCPGLPLPSI